MLIPDPSVFGPARPTTPAPARPVGSIRRTTTIDTHRPEGLLGPPVVEARGRDLVTRTDGSAWAVAAAHVAARLDGPAHTLQAIATDPEVPGVEALVGATVGPGFRAKVDRAAPDLGGSGALVYLLLDDLPGATLVSGYAMLHAGILGDAVPDEYMAARGDLCAGWAVDASMMTMIREHGVNPTPLGPDAPPLTDGDDLATHPAEPLGPFGMRRFRRLDVVAPGQPGQPGAPGARYRVAVFFRDSHVDGDGRESIVHEYRVDATLDPGAGTVATIAATADVLPWRECPGALASAERLVGHPLADLRPWVRQTFVGTSTCTHLNDVLRGFADLEHLVARLDAAAAAGPDARPAAGPAARPDAG